MGLRQDIVKAGKSLCHSLKDFIGIHNFRNFRLKVHEYLIFQSCTGGCDQLYNIFLYRPVFPNQTIIIGNSAKNTIKPHLILIGKMGIKLC